MCLRIALTIAFGIPVVVHSSRATLLLQMPRARDAALPTTYDCDALYRVLHARVPPSGIRQFMIALSTWQRKFASDLLAVFRPARTLARDPSQNGPCEGHVRTYDKHNHGFGGVSAPLYRASSSNGTISAQQMVPVQGQAV